MANKYDIFISYSRKDDKEVRQILQKIRSAVPGITFWIDDKIPAGDRTFDDTIIAAINNSDRVLFFVSNNSLASPWVKDEVLFAKEDKEKMVIPVILKNTSLTDWFKLKFKRTDQINSTIEEQVNKLIHNLKEWYGKTESKQTVLPAKKTTSKKDNFWKFFLLVLFGAFGCVAILYACDGWKTLWTYFLLGCWLLFITILAFLRFLSIEDPCVLGIFCDVFKLYKKAVKWYRKAAEQGDASGQYNLGEMYYYGHGVQKDYSEAVKWYRLSAEQGKALGQYNLGFMYQYGYGVKKDYEEAITWYKKAAEQGDAGAQNNIGFMYSNGYGVEQDYDEALKWYRLSAYQGNANGQNNLGIMYRNGYGVRQDYDEALKWYRKAADQGNADGQYNLGVMYHNGYGVEKSNEDAIKWFKKAAAQGYANAKAALEKLGQK